MRNVKNLKADSNGNPQRQFDTKIVRINRNWTGETPNNKKPFHLGAILVNGVITSANVPLKALQNANIEDGAEVTVVAKKTADATWFNVIGLAGTRGEVASADVFDQIVEGGSTSNRSEVISEKEMEDAAF